MYTPNERVWSPSLLTRLFLYSAVALRTQLKLIDTAGIRKRAKVASEG
jgi:predicted GTPase